MLCPAIPEKIILSAGIQPEHRLKLVFRQNRCDRIPYRKSGYSRSNLLFLYLTILNLFRSPNLTGRFRGDEYFIAALAATFWAVNPIQTQAVTYIVQRMASMAAMFYIIGIFCYLRARLDDFWTRRLLWGFVTLVLFPGVGQECDHVPVPCC